MRKIVYSTVVNTDNGIGGKRERAERITASWGSVPARLRELNRHTIKAKTRTNAKGIQVALRLG